jgi:protein involved in polysaccharide export with SLBB domain
LTKGDFQDGDRIVVQIEGFALLSKAETLRVRSGKLLELPRMSDLTLAGVLRSELITRLTEHLAQYLREPVVRATPLVRVALLGAVQRPGYVYTAADIPLSDVIMKAGGPAGNADIAKVTCRRGEHIIWDAQGVRTALADGLSIDSMHMRAGEEIYVGERRNISWLALATAGTSIFAFLFALFR